MTLLPDHGNRTPAHGDALLDPHPLAMRVVSVPLSPELREAIATAKAADDAELAKLSPDARAIVEEVRRRADRDLDRFVLGCGVSESGRLAGRVLAEVQRLRSRDVVLERVVMAAGTEPRPATLWGFPVRYDEGLAPGTFRFEVAPG